METVKLKAKTKDYIWGGKRLFNYGKVSDTDIIAESWELSFFKDMESLIDSGKDIGKKLSDIASEKDLGKNVQKYPFFPVLIKLIDANDNLSVQVHPSDEYALEHENSYGKTEMWYVLEAKEGSFLHVGLNKDVTEDEVRERIKDNTIMDIMNHIEVKPGDCFFIPSGTLHAIGKGVMVIEIQENSNLTYRVYDYDRRDKNNNPRELHIEKALKVMNYKKAKIVNIQDEVLADYKYFKVKKLSNPCVIEAPLDSFASFTIIEGEGRVDDIAFKKGDTFFVPAGKVANINGKTKVILTTIN